MAAVISDASVLISLASADHLELLRKLYGTVIIPGMVARESLGATGMLRGSEAVNAALAQQWISIADPKNTALTTALSDTLDAGEAQAIALAVETPGALLLIDETDGRAAAKNLGVRVTGTIGVLVRAKKDGHLAALQPLLNRMIADTQFRISRELYEKTLRECGELA